MLFVLRPCTFKFDGLLINISKQSITTATFVLKYCLNDTGVVEITSCLPGHITRGLSLINIFIHFSTTLEIVDLEILNLYDKSFISNLASNALVLKPSLEKDLTQLCCFHPLLQTENQRLLAKLLN